MCDENVQIRSANENDLDAINQIIEQAVMGWQLAERAKRLALPSYRYNELDLKYFTLIVAERNDSIVAVAAWDTDSHQGPVEKNGLLLHGIYVHPEHQRCGIGGRLFTEFENVAREQNMDGVLVKAQNDAVSFFLMRGFTKLDTQDLSRDYENRYWKQLSLKGSG